MLIHSLGCSLGVFAMAVPAAVAQPSSDAGQGPQPYSPQPYPASPSRYPPPTPPPAPYPPQPYPPSAENCLACPAGTVCVNGTCAPAYPPQCPPGLLFDWAGNCVSAGYAPYPANHSQEAAVAAQAQAAREQRRMRSRFTIDLEGSIGLMGDGPDPVITPAVASLFGFRQQFTPWFGLILRGGPLVGIATYEDTASSAYSSSSSRTDSTGMAGAVAEAIPFFGPFGRFYLGPSLSAMYLWFASSGLTSNGSYVSLDSGATLAVGVQMGWVLGDEERTVLSFGIRAAPLNTVTLFFTAAIGFQI